MSYQITGDLRITENLHNVYESETRPVVERKRMFNQVYSVWHILPE